MSKYIVVAMDNYTRATYKARTKKAVLFTNSLEDIENQFSPWVDPFRFNFTSCSCCAYSDVSIAEFISDSRTASTTFINGEYDNIVEYDDYKIVDGIRYNHKWNNDGLDYFEIE